MRGISVAALHGVLLAGVASSAFAQQPAPAQDPGSPPTPPASAATVGAAASPIATSAPSQPPQVGEVVVTARKRTENVQDIPTTIQVVGTTALERSAVRTLTDISAVAPGVNIAQSPNPDQFAVTIRGLGSEPGNPSFDSSVSLFVDGVYSPRGRDAQDALFDLARIEVIRGTQAALLGKNTSLGAINFITNKPGNVFSADLNYQHEFEFNSNLLQGGITLPVNDTLSFRISGKYDQEGGYEHNVIDNAYGLDVHSGAFRIIGVWKPITDLDITALYQTQSRTSDNSNLQATQITGPVPNLLATLAGYPGTVQPNTNYQTAASDSRIPGDSDGLDRETSDRGSITINYHLGEYTLTSQTGYLRSNILTDGDVDFLPGNYFLQQETDHGNQVTEEVRLASPAHQRLEYILGFLYLDGHYVDATVQNASYPFGPAPGLPDIAGSEDTLFNQRDKAYSAFGQANLAIYGPFKAVAGLRFTDETKDVVQSRDLLVPGLYSLFVEPPFAPLHHTVTENNVDGSIGFNYQATRDALLYVSWGQGTKAGGFGDSVSNLAQSEFAAEVARTAEGGFKTQWLGRTLTANGAFFYTTVSNYQLDTFTGTNFVVSNTDLRSIGFESEVDWVPVRDVRVFWNNTYADSSDTRVGGDIPFAPRWSGSAGFSASHPVFESKRVGLDANVDYRTSETSQQQGDLTPRLEALTRVNVSVGFGDPSQGWELRLQARNLNNEFDKDFSFPLPLTPAGNTISVISPPREVFLQLTYKQ